MVKFREPFYMEKKQYIKKAAAIMFTLFYIITILLGILHSSFNLEVYDRNKVQRMESQNYDIIQQKSPTFR